MASGRMEFHADTVMQHANFAFVLPNDVYEPEIKDRRHYARPTKSLILLHGLTGTDTDWLFGGVAQEMAIQYNLAVFMPTAGNNFYLDRGYAGGNWASFVGEELPAYIRRTFGYCQSREDTLIGGLSMGGFGALHTALRYPETFSACVALSSALVLHEVAETGRRENSIMPEAMVRDVFGDPKTLLGSEKDPEFLYRSGKAAGKELPRIYLAIGTEDSLYGVNQDFRRFLGEQGADFCYEEGPGAHNWTFWNEYIDRGLAWVLRDDGSEAAAAEPAETGKKLSEMTNRELFCVLTGDRDVLRQARLQNLILAYRKKHPERVGEGELDLAAIVAEMEAEA